MIHLKQVLFNVSNHLTQYPYSLPWMKHIQSLPFDNDVIIITGDNGCGKSTLMNLLATALNLYRINSGDTPIKSLKENSNIIKPLYTNTKTHGFFFEAEAFITYLHFLVKEKNEALGELKRVETDYAKRSDYAKMMAKVPHQKSLQELDNLYDYDITKRSHGEAYLDFFASRLRPNQIYLLDEPETPLSSQNQLTLLAMIKDAVQNNCQFIIATHSPIIMAYPDALIYQVADHGINKIAYQDIESISLLKQFLNSPEQFLRHL